LYDKRHRHVFNDFMDHADVKLKYAAAL